MATWFVSRHLGAIEWMKKQNKSVDYWVGHLDVDDVSSGDIVIGILPLSLASALYGKNVRFFALVLPQVQGDRGKEHSCQEMMFRGAYLQEYQVRLVPASALVL